MKPILIALLLASICAAATNEDFLEAARSGDLAKVQSALAQTPPPDIETKTPYGQTALYVAAMNGHEPIVQLLLSKGASTNVTDTFYKAPMLVFVLQRKHYGVANLLIAKGGTPPDQVLEQVTMMGTPELVEAALKLKPSQPALDKTYELALSRNRPQMAELLKKAGANPPAPGFEVDAQTLESYAGNYKSDQLPLEIKAFVKEGKLFLQATGQSEFAPKPKSATVFEFAPARLEVEFDSPGNFILRQGGQTFKFRKVAAQ